MLFRALSVISIFFMFLSLSYWQLQRYEYKETLISRLKNNPLKPAITRINDINELEVGRRFSSKLTILPNYSIYIDNSVWKRILGFNILTIATDGNNYVLLDRGWQQKIFVPDKQLDLVVTGTLATIKKPFVLKQEDIVSFEQLPAITTKLSDEFISLVAPLVINIDPDSNLRLGPDLSQNQLLSSTKHLIYAVQWLLAAFLVLIYYYISYGKFKKN